MADAGAWQAGLQIGGERAQERRAHKQALSDEELQGKIKDLIDQRSAIVTKMPTLLDENGKPTAEYNDAFNSLKQVNAGLIDLYHPQKNPNAIKLFGRLLTDHLGIKVNGETLPERRQDKAEAQAAKKDALATNQTNQQIAAGPLSPAQQDTAAAASQLRKMQGTIQNIKTLFPNQPTAVVTRWQNELAQQMAGIKPASEKYFTQLATTEETLPDGTKKEHYWRVPMDPVEQPEEVDFNGQKMVPKASAQKTPKGLSYVAATGLVKDGDTGKTYSVEDIGKSDSPPELAEIFKGAQGMMDLKQKNALALANQRGVSLGANRFAGFVSPNNPTQVIPATWGEAQKRGLHLATGAQYQTMEAMLKSATSGPIGNEIGAFSTSLQHADLLGQAALALNNGDVRLLNRLKNDFATQFEGEEAPTDFNTIAGAYTREVTKALSSGHITDAEIAANGLTIPRDASPAQISGAVNAYKNLMRSKINIRLAQIQAGMAGVPFTGVGGLSQLPSSTPEFVYAKDPQGKVHKAKPGTPLPKGWTLTSAPTQK